MYDNCISKNIIHDCICNHKFVLNTTITYPCKRTIDHSCSCYNIKYSGRAHVNDRCLADLHECICPHGDRCTIKFAAFCDCTFRMADGSIRRIILKDCKRCSRF